MFNNLIGAVLLPIMFYVGSFWGTVGIASAWLVWFPLIALPVFQQVFRVIKLSPLTYLEALRPAVTGSAMMALSMSIVNFTLEAEELLLERMVLSILFGAAAYSGALLLFYRKKVKDSLQVLHMLYTGAQGPATKI